MTGLDLKAYYASAAEILAFWRGAGGLPLPHACGMLAQADAESSLDPVSVGDHKTAFGLHQWHADRIAAIKAGCGIDLRALPPLQDQLKAALWELTHTERRAWAAIKGAQTAYEAGYLACRLWERPGSPLQYDKRGKTAEKWLVHFRPKPPATTAKVA